MNNPFAGLPNCDEVANQFELLRAIFYNYDFVQEGTFRWAINFPDSKHLTLLYTEDPLPKLWYVKNNFIGDRDLNARQYHLQAIVKMLSRGTLPHCRKRTFNELAGCEVQFEKRLARRLADFLPRQVAFEAAEAISRRECSYQPIIGGKNWAAAVMAQKLEGYFLLVEQVRQETLGCLNNGV